MKKNDQDKFDCHDVEKNVQAYLDNRLSENEIQLFEDHLSYCLPCDKKIEFEKKLNKKEKIYSKKLLVISKNLRG